MSRKITFSTEARDSLKRGIDTLANAVKVTLGPKGRNVIIDRGYGAPMVTKDGVSVAREISLEDKQENLGVNLIKEVASKTADIAGDGTTTSTVIAQAMVEEGLKLVTAGIDPQGLRRGIERAVDEAVDEIAKLSQEVKGDAIRQVASISANDPEMGEKIAEVIQKVGKDGVVTIEEGPSFGVEVEHVDGMEIKSGFITHHMVTDKERMEALHDNPAILVTDMSISNIQAQMLPLMELLVQANKKLVIFADNVEGEALALFVVNNLQGKFMSVAVKAPGFGDDKKLNLEDIAIATGATLISDTQGMKLENATLEDLGTARKVIVTQDKTTIVEGAGDIKEHVKQLKTLIEQETSEHKKGKLQERHARLTGGVAVIKVGAASEVEMKEKTHRIEDAVAATKAALEEGIVEGGGVTLIKAQKAITVDSDSSEGMGASIVVKALESPLYWIAANAGEKGDVIVEKVRSEGKGFNALTGEFEEDMIKAGIVDPAKVTRSALQNAASIATMVITTEAAITDIPNEQDKS